MTMLGTFKYLMHDIVTTNIISFWAKAQMVIHCLTQLDFILLLTFFLYMVQYATLNIFLSFKKSKCGVANRSLPIHTKFSMLYQQTLCKYKLLWRVIVIFLTNSHSINVLYVIWKSSASFLFQWWFLVNMSLTFTNFSTNNSVTHYNW